MQPQHLRTGTGPAPKVVLYLGAASKQVMAWTVDLNSAAVQQPSAGEQPQVVADGYTGWVRALAVCGHSLFRCGDHRTEA